MRERGWQGLGDTTARTPSARVARPGSRRVSDARRPGRAPLTRFQRLHLTIGLSALAVLACMAAARAQTIEEAARANLELALSLCLRAGPGQEALNAAFLQAGFAYTPEDFGGGEIAHWFEAPARTVTVLVSSEGRHGYCAAQTDHVGVSDALALAGSVLEAQFPGVFTYGEMEGGAPVTPASPDAQARDCTGYIGWSGQRPLIVKVGTAGQDPVCVETGTSQIMVTM